MPGYVSGFLFSVVADIVNVNEKCPSDPFFGIIDKEPIRINSLWGKLKKKLKDIRVTEKINFLSIAKFQKYRGSKGTSGKY